MTVIDLVRGVVFAVLVFSTTGTTLLTWTTWRRRRG